MVIHSGRMSPFLNQVMAGLLLELAHLSLHSLTTFMLKLAEVAFAFGDHSSCIGIRASSDFENTLVLC